jgi:Glycosyl transferase 4-like domain
LKRVLIIGADFAPSSYPPALRIRYFVQHLREFGWEPVVLTTDPSYYETVIDEENQKLLPADLEVIRTRAIPATLTRKFHFGDLGLRSLWHHWRAINRICRERRVDLIFVPIPPYPSIVLGRLAHARFGIPYVIDYIDPYVTEYYWKLPRSQRPPKHALAYYTARVVEPFALKYVAAVVGVDTSYTADLFERYPWLKVEATSIPYGGEPSDFEYLRQHPRANPIFNPRDGLLHVSYIGRGGPDMLPSLRAVFEAVVAGAKQWPDLLGRLRVHFVGTTYAHQAEGQYQVLGLAKELGLGRCVDEHPERVSSLTAMQIMLDSHALLAVGSESVHYTASKIFPCILAARPLLAVFHEKSSVVSILKETQAGDVIEFGASRPVSATVEDIAGQLRNLLAMPPNSRPPTRWEVFERYTAKAMTRRLAAVFDGAVGSDVSQLPMAREVIG